MLVETTKYRGVTGTAPTPMIGEMAALVGAKPGLNRSEISSTSPERSRPAGYPNTQLLQVTMKTKTCRVCSKSANSRLDSAVRSSGYALVLLAVVAACSAATESRRVEDGATSKDRTAEPSDAGVPLPLWQSGPAVREAPRTFTRPYTPRP